MNNVGGERGAPTVSNERDQVLVEVVNRALARGHVHQGTTGLMVVMSRIGGPVHIGLNNRNH